LSLLSNDRGSGVQSVSAATGSARNTLERSCTKEFNEAEVKSVENHAEALVAASHAIYKERIYTLNDYFTVEKWASEKALKLAQELKCGGAIKTAIDLNREIRLGTLEMPYKIPTLTWLAMLAREFQADQTDSLTRATSINTLGTLTNKRIGNLLTSKLIRETYQGRLGIIEILKFRREF